jgi:hypothetical protein
MSGASNLSHQAATHKKNPMADLTAAKEWFSEFGDKLDWNIQTKNHHTKPMKSNDQGAEKKEKNENDEQGTEDKNRKKNNESTRNKGGIESARQGQTSHREKSNVSSPDLLVFASGLKTTVKMPDNMSAVMRPEVRFLLIAVDKTTPLTLAEVHSD